MKTFEQSEQIKKLQKRILDNARSLLPSGPYQRIFDRYVQETGFDEMMRKDPWFQELEQFHSRMARKAYARLQGMRRKETAKAFRESLNLHIKLRPEFAKLQDEYRHGLKKIYPHAAPSKAELAAIINSVSRAEVSVMTRDWSRKAKSQADSTKKYRAAICITDENRHTPQGQYEIARETALIHLRSAKHCCNQGENPFEVSWHVKTAFKLAVKFKDFDFFWEVAEILLKKQDMKLGALSEPDRLERFLMDHWVSSNCDVPDLFDLSRDALCRVCAKGTQNPNYSIDAVDKVRQRLGLRTFRNGRLGKSIHTSA